ncbi:tail protein X [Novosphingobium colocasiae]|uniref:Tail protein X n=1 Tax=Novosphingobium colocasiae TaxID=1256513 RepID=A0A918UF15_9SPHN|nr:tail protein X [Novosphingobium colocasiae]GGZ02749.1 tail protein X [Novosphingobium colocasiae]
MTTATTFDGETLDALCWRVLGRTAGVTEQVLALNPALATLGTALPAGIVVTLPELTEIAPSLRETVQLWD